jgi:hypothetical protein
LAISCPNANVFNINTTTNNFNYGIYQNVFLSALSMGTVGGYVSVFSFRLNSIGNGITSGMTNGGFTVTGVNNLNLDILDNYSLGNNGIAFNLGTSVWNNVFMVGNKITVNAGQTIISGLVNSGNLTFTGIIDNNVFSGSGTYFNNILPSDLKWQILANSPNVPTSENIGECYMNGNTTPTTFTTSGVYTKVLGTTTAGELSRFSMPTSNRLTYIGLNTVNLFLTIAFSMTKSTNGAIDIKSVLYKNGITPITSTTSNVNIKNNGDLVSAVVQGYVLLNPNDFIELWVSNITNTTSIIVNTMNFSIG